MSNKGLKGLVMNVRPQGQPEDTYPYGKNGLQGNVRGVIENEPGFLLAQAQAPYRINGIIESDKFPIIFSTNNVYSAVGYYNPDEDSYIPILDDAALPFKLGFSTDYYITGQAQRNYKSEILVAFTDKRSFPKILNCDSPNVGALADLNLFPVSEAPQLQTKLTSSGTLTPGAYIVAQRYLKYDGTETGFVAVSDILIVPGNADIVSDKSITITLSNCDPNYDQVQIAIISKIKGILKSVLMEPVTLSESVITVYTGANLTTDIALEEVLISPPVYTRVGTIGQLNDALYIGDLEKDPEIDMQPWANLIRLQFHSELITPSADEPRRGFMHQEVYAAYVRYKRTAGGFTKAFIIPGLQPTALELATSTEAATGGMPNMKKYQVEDTIRTFNPTTFDGDLGIWQNENELYPDTASFDSTTVGGPNLRGVKVCHHRMPSIGWCKENLYKFEASYGKSKLDLLGLKVTNVIIPDVYKDQLDGYEILYAKRSIEDATVLGQSLTMHAGRKGNRNTLQIDSPDTNYLSTAGNWHSWTDWTGEKNDKPIIMDPRLVRFHSFDMLFNRPQVSPAYLAPQLKHRRNNLYDVEGYIEDGSVPPGSKNGPLVYLIDYVTKGVSPAPVGVGKKVRKVVSSQWVPSNTPTGDWNNTQMEATYGMKLAVDLMPYADFSISTLLTGKGNHSYNPRERAAKFETTYLANLMSVHTDVYSPFSGQTLVRAGKEADVIYGGDVFLCDYTFHSLGWHSWSNEDWNEEVSTLGAGGIRAVRRFVCEAVSNINSRYEIPGNQYSKWYPKFPLANGDPKNYITLFNNREEPNQFGYNKDLNAINDILSISVFNSVKEEIFQFPFRIHRGGKLSRQSQVRSWRTFLPLDYYEAQKNMGRIIHLEGMDDHLIIHHENAMFLTQDKVKLEQDVLKITLGSGDIFQFEPQEALSSKLGYAGTQHDLACVRTPVAYLFPDSRSGNFFLFKKTLKLLNEGLHNFFQSFLRVKETNVFTGNGYTIGYDQENRRFLLTAKNQRYTGGTVRYDYEETPEYFATLQVGDIVFKNGRFQQYLGPNTTIYACSENQIPNITSYLITIPESTPVGTEVLQVVGTNVKEYYLVTQGSPFTLNPITGELSVIGGLNYDLVPQYVLSAKAVSPTGHETAFTITVDITEVEQLPEAGDMRTSILETAVLGSEVITVVSDSADAVTYAIVGGNASNKFVINGATGVINTAGFLSYEMEPLYQLQVSIANGAGVKTINVYIDVVNVNEPPHTEDKVVTIYDTTASGAVVASIPGADPEGGALNFRVEAESIPGVFELNPTTGQVTLISNDSLNPVLIPQYTLRVMVTDPEGLQSIMTLTINVVFDPFDVIFEPFDGICSGGCAPGWTLSPDGLFCERITTVPANPPTGGGPPITVAAVTNPAYSNFGAVIYQPGFQPNGVGTVLHHMTGQPVWANPAVNNVDGPLNRTGLWGASAVPDNEYIGFSVPVVLPAAKTYYVAIAGDNACRIKVNGVTLINQDPIAIANSLQAQLPVLGVQGINLAFKIWHIYPISLLAGTSYITLEGVNYGSAAAFGAEIYDNTIAELQAAALNPAYVSNPGSFPAGNYYTNLNLIFSTRDQRGQTLDSGTTVGYSCNPGYALDGTPTPPVCVLVEKTPATGRSWSTSRLKSTRLGTYVQVFNNVPGQTYMGMPVPYYPPVANHVDCGGSVTPYYNAPQNGSARKDNCVTGTGSLVVYAVPGGLYVSLVSQDDANQQARENVDENKQLYANLNGSC